MITLYPTKKKYDWKEYAEVYHGGYKMIHTTRFWIEIEHNETLCTHESKWFFVDVSEDGILVEIKKGTWLDGATCAIDTDDRLIWSFIHDACCVASQTSKIPAFENIADDLCKPVMRMQGAGWTQANGSQTATRPGASSAQALGTWRWRPHAASACTTHAPPRRLAGAANGWRRQRYACPSAPDSGSRCARHAAKRLWRERQPCGGGVALRLGGSKPGSTPAMPFMLIHLVLVIAVGTATANQPFWLHRAPGCCAIPLKQRC